MSVPYGGQPYGGQPYGPPRQVNFGWIGESWEYVSQAIGVWIVAMLAFVIVAAAVGAAILIGFHDPNAGSVYGSGFGGGAGGFGNYQNTMTLPGRVIYYLFEWLAGSFLAACFSGMAVKQVKTGQLGFGDIFSGAAYYLPFLGLYWIFFAASLVGMLLLCVGLFVVLGLLFPVYALVADGEGVFSAVSTSISAMSKSWLPATGLTFVMTLIIIISAIPCGLGVLVTMPMMYVMMALAYRDMIGFPGSTGGYAYGQQAYPGQYPQAPGAWPPAPGQGYTPPQPPPYGEAPGQPPYGTQPPPQFGQPPASTPPWPQQNPTPPEPQWPQQNPAPPPPQWPPQNPAPQNPPQPQWPPTPPPPNDDAQGNQ